MLFVWTNLLWISAINLRAGEEDEPVAHNCAQPRSRLEWHHLCSDHIKVAVGGADFSSVQRHLTPLDVYLARSHADAQRCQHLFVLPVVGSWSFFCFFMSHTLCHFLLLSQRPDYLFFSVFSGFCTLSFSGGFCQPGWFAHIFPFL